MVQPSSENPSNNSDTKPSQSQNQNDNSAQADPPNSLKLQYKKVSSIKNMYNPNPWGRLIGEQNVAVVQVNDRNVIALLDTGCQVSNISEEYCVRMGLPIYPIDHLTDIHQADGAKLKYLGFTEITLKCSQLPGLDIEIPVLVVPTTDYHAGVPLTIGTLTLAQMIDSDILKNDIDLPTSWKCVYHSIILKRKLAETPAKSLGKVKLSRSTLIAPYSAYAYQCVHKVKGFGMDLAVIIEPKSKRLKGGIHLQPSHNIIKAQENKIYVVLENETSEEIILPKGTVVGSAFLGNVIPEVISPGFTPSVKESNDVSGQTRVKQRLADETNPKFDLLQTTLKQAQNEIKVNMVQGQGKNKSQLGSDVSSCPSVDASQLNLGENNPEKSPGQSFRGDSADRKSGQTRTPTKVIKDPSKGIQKNHNKSNKDSSNTQNKSDQVDPGGDDGTWVHEKLDLSGMSEWSPHLQLKAKALLAEYSDIFSKHDLDLGRTSLAKHDIQLTDYTPFKSAYRRIPPHLYDQVKAHLQEMLDLGAIRKSYSPWSSAIVLVQKKDGGIRFCIDLRQLNSRTVKDNYSLPKIEHHLEQLLGATWFTTLDLKSGYWQVELTEEAKPLTAFTVGPLGFFECDTMPFGASNAPATFQRLMDNCLGDLNLKWCVVYLDDIIIYAGSPEEHLERLRAVFDKLRLAGLKLKPSKCTFFQQEITYLGHIVSDKGIATDPSKIEKVKHWPVPSTVNEVRSFLGFVGYFRKYIKGFSQIAKPLCNLTAGLETSSKKAASKIKVKWTEIEQQAFDTLKSACVSAPVLGYADFSKPFILHTDSSLDGLGAVLYQIDENDHKKPIAFASRGLTKSERNYPAHKLEFLALKWAVTDKFKEYLYGAPFQVFTDNNPLTYVLTTAKLDATTQRWVAALASYDFEIFYRAGKHNLDADALSRIKWPDELNEILIDRKSYVQINKEVIDAIFMGVRIPYGFSEILCLQSSIIPSELDNATCGLNKEQWVKKQQDDTHINLVIEIIQNKLHRKIKNKQLREKYPQVEPYFRYFPQLLVRDNLLYRKVHSNKGKDSYLLQLVLPKSLQPDALFGCHNEVGHLGRDKSLELLKERFFWPSMSKDLGDHVNSCRKCIARKASTSKAELCPINVTKPLELVHLDYLQLEPSKGNIENVLVITDHYTRFSQAYPSKTQTAQATAKLLWDNFIIHYGWPEKFFSDQGRNFVSELIADLCRIANVQKIKTTPYHPMSNGQCERFNKTLCDMLGTMSPEDKLDWKSHIGAMTHAYNCTKNASTGYSPYYLMFGRQPRLPIDVKFGLFRNLSTSTFSKSKYVDRLKKRLDFAFKKAQLAQEKESKRQKQRYDRKAKHILLQEKDLVLVRVVAHKGRHKIQNRWEDEEYVVVRQPDPSIPVFVVKPISGGKERTLHRNLLLPLGTQVDSHSDENNDSSSDEEIEVILPQSGSNTSKTLEQDNSKSVSLDTSTENEFKENSDVLCDPSLDSLVKKDLVPLFEEEESKDTSSVEQTGTTTLHSDNLDDSIRKDLDKYSVPSEETSDNADTGLTGFFEDLLQDKDQTVQSGKCEDLDSVNQLAEQLDQLHIEESQNDSNQKSEPEIESENSVQNKQTSSESESESEELKPSLRRSKRSTKGAPPTRYGYAYSHQNIVKENNKDGNRKSSMEKKNQVVKINKQGLDRQPEPILKDAVFQKNLKLIKLYLYTQLLLSQHK